MPGAQSILEIINPNPKQLEFLLATLRAKYVCYGGAAGGGKSYILRWWLLLVLIEAYTRYGIEKGVVGMFCEDYPALQGRQISQIATDPKFKQFGVLKGDQTFGHSFQLHKHYGGGIILLRNLDDPSKYDSFEFIAVAVDEYTKNKSNLSTGQTVFNELRKRLRWKAEIGKPHFPCGGKIKGQGRCREHEGKPKYIHTFGMGTNPGGPGHAEVKALWIDEDFTKYPNLMKVKDKFAFIKALATDNPYLTEDYYDDLMTLPENMRKAYAEGDWNCFTGQFWSEWRDQYHVVQPEELGTTFKNGIPQSWKLNTSMDWGFNPDPAYNGWFATGPDGTVYLYRESYGCDLTPQEWGREWAALSKGENIAQKIGDPSIKSKESQGQSVLNMFHEVGWDMILGNNDRANGWTQMHRYLAWKADSQGRLTVPPKFKIFPNCKYAIRTIPAQMHSKTKVTDMADGEDHACDAIRYFLMSMPEPAKQDLGKLDPRWREAMMRLQHAQTSQL